MESKVKFSDVIRFILLGGITSLLIASCLYLLYGSIIFNQSLKIMKDYHYIILIFSLFVFFIIGVLLQGIRLQWLYLLNKIKWLDYFCKPKQRLFRSCILPVYYNSYETQCKVLKKSNSKQNVLLPSWIYTSDHPDRLIGIIEAHLKCYDKDIIDNEYKTFNMFFTSVLIPIRLILFPLWFCFIMFGLSFFVDVPYIFNNIVLGQKDVFFLFFILLLLMRIIVAMLSRRYAFEYIKQLGEQCKAVEEKNQDYLRKIYSYQGEPTAYVLIRTSSKKNRKAEEFLSRSLRSVAAQTYNSIHVIVLEDVEDEKNKTNIVEDTINNIVRCNKRLENKVEYSFKKLEGAAGSVYEIRNIFLKTAGKNDICIMLDDDDEFARPDAVEDIVVQLIRNNADVCISSFISKNNIRLDITNQGGKVHNDLVGDLEENPSCFNDMKYCKLSSIGWTKSYKYDIVKRYQKILEPCEKKFKDLKFYEDFPDIIALLLRDVCITGIHKPIYFYNKTENSVTASYNINAFKNQRAGFLALLLQLVKENEDKLCNDAWKYTVEFVVFKTIQIENILCKFLFDYNEIYEEKRIIKEFIFTKWLVEKINDDIKNNDIKNNLKDFLSNYYCCEMNIEISCKDSDELLNLFIKAMLKQIRGDEDKIDLSSMKKFYKSDYFPSEENKNIQSVIKR